MRPGPVAIVGALLMLTPILAACGGGGSVAPGGDAAQAGEPRSAPVATAPCRGRLGGFLDSLDELRSGLAVGLSYDAYRKEVDGVMVSYADVPVGRLSLGCLARVAAPAERALNRYVDGVNTWGDCLASASCEPESVEPKLQRTWELASDHLSAAHRGLRELR